MLSPIKELVPAGFNYRTLREKNMIKQKKIILGIVFLILPFMAFSQTKNIEKIVVIRHAEKPPAGLGQLTCQGLNRALKLPQYLINQFPHPSFIFAPNPSVKITERHGDGKAYSYIRPLATIEPTGIQLGLPVNTQIGYNQIHQLMTTLLKKHYHGSTIYVAWEHVLITKFAQQLLKKFNNHSTVPPWPNKNYDMVFVFTIDWNKQPATLNFYVTQEGIKNLSNVCPNG